MVETAGASHGLHLILTTLLDMDGVIFVDEATYMIALVSMAAFDKMKIVSGMQSWAELHIDGLIVFFFFISAVEEWAAGCCSTDSIGGTAQVQV